MILFTTSDPWFAQVGWTLAIIFAALAVIQLVYLGFLMLWPTGERRTRQPKEPVMPTKPSFTTTKAALPPQGSRMVVMAGVASTGDIPLPADKFTIGRYYNAEAGILVALDERSMSRRHAQFVGDDERREYYLTDLHSSYGTALQRADGLVVLTPGTRMRIYNEDLVQFGQAVVVKFALPGEPRPFEPVATQSVSNFNNIPARGR